MSAWICGILVAGHACRFEGQAEGNQRNSCNRSEDCSSGRCEPELGICVAEAGAPYPLGFEVTVLPAGASNILRYRLPAELREERASTTLALPTARAVVGTVRRELIPEQGVAARVAIAAAEQLDPEGRLLRAATTVAEARASRFSDDIVDYALELTTRGQHRVDVEPLGADAAELPPLRFEDVDIGDERVLRLDARYPQSLRRFFGRVVRIVLPGGQQQSVSGLLVRALDPELQRVVSTTAQTGSDGEFALTIDPSAESYLVEIRNNNDDVEIPTIVVDSNDLPLGDAESPSLIRVPDLTTLQVRGFVRTGPELGDAPVFRVATLWRSADVFDEQTRLSGSYRASDQTDLRGQFDVRLFPGSYELVLTPDDSSGLAVHTTRLRFETPEDGSGSGDQLVNFALERKSRVQGRLAVVGLTQGLGAASVQFAALRQTSDPSAPSDARAFNRTVETQAGPDGLYEADLDAGSYEVTVRPSSGDAYPWLTQRMFVVERNDEDLRLDLQLSLPVPWRGQLVDADGAPVVGAEIRAFTTLQQDDGSQREIALAVEQSGENGEFVLLLPPESP